MANDGLRWLAHHLIAQLPTLAAPCVPVPHDALLLLSAFEIKSLAMQSPMRRRFTE
jgi:hypothetical protein